MKSVLDWIYESTSPPEIPFSQLQAGNFRDMAWPVLVAAECEEQFREFVWREGLICSEVRRFIGTPEQFSDERYASPDKVLLLLPHWWECEETRDLVDWWVAQDRYTYNLEKPLPAYRHLENNTNRALVLIGIALAALVVWLVV